MYGFRALDYRGGEQWKIGILGYMVGRIAHILGRQWPGIAKGEKEE